MRFRPLGARIVACVAGSCLVVVFLAVTFALSPEIRSVFTVLQTGTLVLILLCALAVLWGIARCRVDTDERGIQIVNGYRTHRLPWEEVVDVSLRDGSAWATLTATGERSFMLLAIQTSDGARALDAVWYIREQLLEGR